ncbi:peptidase M23 [Fulvitalea axinellae]|uniref:Peptidase M23 n=1 Tax=Fulvitalea axinellae TaxID=1182444 RepID=A0AAU9D9T7_9BACT|nr:peptidase M23 [Fulvitalea axinellae]
MKKLFYSVVALVAGASAIYFLFDGISQEPEASVPMEVADTVAVVAEQEKLYGIIVDSLNIEEGTVKEGENLSSILNGFGVSQKTVHEIATGFKDVFDVRKIKVGNGFTALSQDSVLSRFVYEIDPVEYVVFDLSSDSLNVYREKKEVEFRERTLSGVITSSMYNAITDQGVSPLLANKLADVYAWQVDFFHIQKGDRFRLIYEEKLVDDEVIGFGKIKASEFNHFGKEYFAYLFENGDTMEYFDEEGNSLRKAFLKAPLKFSRISSRFSRRRFHPVQKRYKAHLGTDYAAPRGTPIMSVGDGVVVEARYSRYNGNYVKVRHNSVYTTQYLHMSKIKSGIRSGKTVKQGQVIGFVGSTGLATGNHLCYRFWKNGRQVDALRVELPASKPLPDSLRLAFGAVKDQFRPRLAEIEYPEEERKLLAEIPSATVSQESTLEQ